MKIKIDFVTNSSSTAFVVFIPDRFKVSWDEARDAYRIGLTGAQGKGDSVD